MATSGSIILARPSTSAPVRPAGAGPPGRGALPVGAAGLVLELLRSNPGLSPTQIRFALVKPDRTVRYALRSLERAGLVEWRLDPRDPRFRRYRAVTGGRSR